MAYDTNNPFARILRGELPSIQLAEDDGALAIMDIMPQADGHVLVIPKAPAEQIFDLPDAALVAGIRMTQRLAVAVRKALEPDGVFVGQFNGAAAGQTVPHVHFHVIPRWKGSDLRLHAREQADPDKLRDLAQRIRQQLEG
ncbi:MAG: HIT family protein [Betaproteobacteria bacterium]|nr:HIT family protein [Betaproteobacteria bacterium]MBU6511948.1 HIT family protein [Betaproteobacteria bacterium]MDE1956330.1 HIT family protein [Betaproteobacteria bacterium]MDE2152178.1 HIT family protein [Betaproteobacteria bacterium]MDE2477264.1 HIT family protein [Betaproteobacteria bacterium]